MMSNTFRRASSAIADEQLNAARQTHMNHFCITDASLKIGRNSGCMLPSQNPIGYAVLSVTPNNKFCNHCPANIVSINLK